MMKVLDNAGCKLGEGALWHPKLKQLFWFDILNAKLYSHSSDTAYCWTFDEMVSAAGWVDEEQLIIASERALLCFNIRSGELNELVPLEADNKVTRSNDGRADPWGGFWIGTMGKKAEPAAGAIYRYFNGELRKLVSDITISNAICFAPDHSCAYYTDTPTRKVMRQPLNAKDGWPEGDAELFLDLNADELNPDGAVTDSEGNLWLACWGDSAVRAFNIQGEQIARIDCSAAHVSCPAFGGLDYSTLYVTTAQQDVPKEQIEKTAAGQTFYAITSFQGRPEPAVQLSSQD